MRKNQVEINIFYGQRGFSMIELLIVISLIVGLAALSMPVYGNYYTHEQLNVLSAEISEALVLSRVRAKTAYRNSSYGVYLDFNRVDQSVISYVGDSYLSRDVQYDEEIRLPQAVFASSSFVNSDINFLSFTGNPEQSGSIELRHQTDNRRIIISLNPFGLVDIE